MKIQVRAKSLDVAVIKAAGELAAAQEDISYNIVEQKSGFCGLGKQVIIEAWKCSTPAAGTRLAPSRSTRSQSKKPRAELSSRELVALQEELREYLSDMLRTAFSVTDEINISQVDHHQEIRWIFDVQSQKISDFLSQDGKLAHSLEHLMRKKPRHLKRELPFKIFVDGLSWRQNREQELMASARKASEEAVENQRSVVMHCESPHDRRTIHLALREDQRVRIQVTREMGRKRLLIVPASHHGSS